MRALIFSVLALTLTTACGNRGADGVGFRDIGPEQSTFVVTPAAPLETPPALILPEPTPGGTNRATR
ncbi:MAG: hypothetical protein ACJAVT_001139 [Yoonia sp.]|jgi:hypothetical protein